MNENNTYQIKIETLSPVHIGDGVLLQNRSDFITVRDANETYNYVVDPQKVLNLIGVGHLSDWVAAIDRHALNTLDFVRQYKREVKPMDLAKRKVLSFSQVRPNDTLKECIHNGMGLPYIPGSSIKGALRTAILARLVRDLQDVETKVIRGQFSAKQVEAELFGSSPNSDIFRFLIVGDAYFRKNCEISTRMENLNIRQKNELRDGHMSQLVEAIATSCSSVFQLKLATEAHQNAQGVCKLSALPECMRSLPALFKTLNEHTSSLIRDEIELWSQKSDDGYEGADDYIDVLTDIQTAIRECREGEECVLRIRHGSGWRFITGAWCEDLENFTDIINKARPRNYNYQKYVFPKTRRLDEDSDILGFVRLSHIIN